MRLPEILLIASVAAALLLHSGSTHVGAVNVGDCGSSAKLHYVDIENCGEKDPRCPMVRGTNASIEVSFMTTASFKVAKVDIGGDNNVHFDIKPDDACGNYGLNCPVAANREEVMRLAVPVSANLSEGLQTQISFKLQDENQKNIFCVTFPVTVVSQ